MLEDLLFMSIIFLAFMLFEGILIYGLFQLLDLLLVALPFNKKVYKILIIADGIVIFGVAIKFFSYIFNHTPK